MTSKIRVLLVGNDADYFLSHRLPLAEALCKRGYELHVALPCQPDDWRFKQYSFLLHQIPLQRGGMRASEDLKTISRLFVLYKHLQPTVVHHVTLKPTLYGGIVARMTGTPIVINAMTGLGYVFNSDAWQARVIRSLSKLPLRMACRRRNVAMIFQNPEDRARFEQLGLCRRGSGVLIRGSGVDVRSFHPRTTPVKSTEPVVMCASRMLWDKGIMEFVSAARLLKGAGVRARFVLVGGTDPNPTSVPEATLRSWVDEGIVEWWGRRSDMPDVWRQADIGCLPSYAEGLPKCLLEAAATGLPLVATDIPGCREIVRMDSTGLLVRKGDAGHLAEALGRLIADSDLRRRLGGNARNVVEEEFTVEEVVNQTVALYEQLINASAAGHA